MRDNYRDDAPGHPHVAPRLRGPLHHVECAGEVRLNDRTPAFLAEIDSGLRKLATRAVDQQIDTPLPGEDIVEQSLHAGALADIERGGLTFKASFGDGGTRSRQLLGVSTADDDLGTQTCGEPGVGSPDTTATSGDHDNAPRQKVLRQGDGACGQVLVTQNKGLFCHGYVFQQLADNDQFAHFSRARTDLDQFYRAEQSVDLRFPDISRCRRVSARPPKVPVPWTLKHTSPRQR